MNCVKTKHIYRPWMKPFQTGTPDNDIILPSRGIRLIGVRLYPGGDSPEDMNRAKHIQKSLYNKTNWFYFYKGFTIIEKAGAPTEIDHVEVKEDVFDSSEFLYSGPQKMKISVSAIVGENGTGKSTILDTIIRVMNNLSAAIFGEGYNYTSAEHLHYIDSVYASLAVYVDTRVEIITCRGRNLTVTRFETDIKKLIEVYDDKDRKGLFTEKYYQTQCDIILDGTTKKEELLPDQGEKRSILRHLFYTLVSNYSLYAYNYRDYLFERTDETRLAEIINQHPELEFNEEDAYWLKGVFHKNDGYQTPVVIHPMREKGYINADKVNYLGKHNLISLAFEQRERISEDGVIEKYFPFRIINQTHHLVAFYFYPENYKQYQGFWKDCALKRFNERWARSNEALIKRLEQPIREFWIEELQMEYQQCRINDLKQQAWDYLIYKTIKIINTYKHYATDWKVAKQEDLDVSALKKQLKNIQKDSTHRTAKLRRTVAFLRFYNNQDYYLRERIVDLNIIYDWMQRQVGMQLYPLEGTDSHKIEVEDLLPPPFVDVVLQLVDNEHIEDYDPNGGNTDIIPFEGLSSGERQIAYSIANIIYHLKNIGSGRQDKNVNPYHTQAMSYNYVNILLDEVELYFHPDLQRRFVSLLVDSIRGLHISGNYGINITMVTHSPFVLSDIPESNILFLSRNGGEELKRHTFAANIHDMFNDAFFLPSTVGEIAQQCIEKVVDDYNSANVLRKQKTGRRMIDNRSKEVKEYALSRDLYWASIVGDEYLQDEMVDMIDEMTGWQTEINQCEND